MCFDLGFLRSYVKTWGAVHTIAVEQCHCRHLQFLAARNQALRQGRAFEKTEGGTGVEFDVQRQLFGC